MQEESITVTLEPAQKEFPSPADVVINATLHNTGDAPLTLILDQISSSSLTLQIEDSSGKHVLLPSPPVPNDDSKRVTVSPGQSHRVELAGMFDLGQPGGAYRLRYHYTEPESRAVFRSDWVQITVNPARIPVRESLTTTRPGCIYALICILFYKILRVRKRCTRVASVEVDRAVTETITNAPPPHQAWNNTYSWHARFLLSLDQPRCRVTVTVRLRITGAATAAQQTAWKNAIEAKWSNQFKLCCREDCCKSCCPNGYTIFCDVQFVSNNEHHVVNGCASTSNMTNWGSAETIDVTHEFGHMLGNKEEYFTVDGVDYGAHRQPGGNIMNNPANNPVPSHFDLVREEAESLIGAGTRCVARAVNEAC